MLFAFDYLTWNFFTTLKMNFFAIHDVNVLAVNQRDHNPLAVEVNQNIFCIHLSFQPSSTNKTFVKHMRKKLTMVRLRCKQTPPSTSLHKPQRGELLSL